MAGVNWGQVRLVLALRWTLLLRTAGRHPVLAALGAAGALFGAAVVGVLCAVAYVWMGGLAARGDIELATSAVHLTYLVVFVGLLLSPVLGIGADPSLDVGRLFQLPVGNRTLLAATTVSLSASPSALTGAALLASVTAGFGGGASTVAANLGIAALLLLAGVLAGQFLLLLLLGTLRGRVWRDVSVLVIALASGGLYLALHLVLFGGGVDAAALGHVLASFGAWRDTTLILPSWWAAHAVTATGWTRFLPVLGLAALSAWLVGAAAERQQRVAGGEGGASGVASTRRGLGRRSLARLFPGRFGALVEKEFAVLRREPAIRLLLLRQGSVALLPLVLVLGRQLSARPGPLAGPPPLDVWALAVYPLLLAELALLFNQFGADAGGVTHVLLTPVGRERWVQAKQFVHLAVFAPVNAVVVAAVVWTVALRGGAGPPPLAVTARTVLESVCATAVVVGTGSIASVLSPFALGGHGRGAVTRSSRGGGFFEAVRAALSVPVALVLLGPVAWLFHHPALARAAGSADTSGRLGVTMAAAAALAAAALAGGAWAAGRLLGAGEDRLAAALSPRRE